MSISIKQNDNLIGKVSYHGYIPIKCYRVLSFGEHRAMLMLRSYMDESGKYDDPSIQMVSVCGVISSLERWTHFESKWKDVLDEYSVFWFHMKDFAHHKGEFEGWKEPIRREFIGKLMKVIDERVMGCLAATMSKYDFDNLTENQKLALGNDPYYPCFLACIIHSAETAFNLAPDEQVELFFADNPGFKTKAYEFYERCKAENVPEDIRKRLGPITLNAEPRKVLPLQAADLVAYEVNHNLTEMFKQKKWPEGRWPFNRVKDRMFFIEYFDKNTLAERFGF